jgi:hypothetical protein
MNKKSAIITQSNYIPWKGYFDSIRQVDVFIVYDDMQYTKRDWRNRNLIKTPQGLKWLTIPVEVKGKYFQKIKDTKVAEKNWNLSHWEIIKQNYKTARSFNQVSEWIESIYRNCNFDFLTDVNVHFINAICEHFNIKTEIRFSSEFQLADDKTERLANICADLQVTDYYSGPAAQAYMEVDKFNEKNVEVHYWNYNDYPEYQQVYGDFEHGVSIIDLLMNEGLDSIQFLNRLHE